MRIDAGEFLRTASAILEGQIRGALAAEEINYQRGQREINQQTQQFVIGAGLEERQRNDELEGVDRTLALGKEVSPPERGAFYTDTLQARQNLVNTPRAYNVDALAGVGTPGYRPPTLPGRAVGPAAAVPPASGPGQGGAPPPGSGVSPGAGAAALAPSLLGQQGQPPAAPPSLFGQFGQGSPLPGTYGTPGEVDPMLLAGARTLMAAGQYIPQGQEIAAAATQQLGLAPSAAVNQAGPSGAGGTAQSGPVSAQAPGIQGQGQAGATQAPGIPRQQPPPTILTEGGLPYGTDPLTLGGEAETPATKLKTPYGPAGYTVAEVDPKDARQVWQALQKAKDAVTRAVISDPARAAQIRQALSYAPVKPPTTLAEVQAADFATKLLTMATLGTTSAQANLGERQNKSYRDTLKHPGANARYYVEASRAFLQRQAADPGVDEVDLVSTQPEFAAMKEKLAKGDEPGADEIAAVIRARFQKNYSPAAERARLADFLKVVGNANVETLANPKLLRQLANNAGVGPYFEGVPDDELFGLVGGARAEKLLEAFYKSMPAASKLGASAQHALVSRARGIARLLAQGGNAKIEIPAKIVVALSEGEAARLAIARQNLAIRGEANDIRLAEIALRRGQNNTALKNRTLTQNERVKQLGQAISRAHAELRVQLNNPNARSVSRDLAIWNADHAGQEPPGDNKGGDDSLRAAWLAERKVEAAEKALNDYLNQLAGESGVNLDPTTTDKGGWYPPQERSGWGPSRREEAAAPATALAEGKKAVAGTKGLITVNVRGQRGLFDPARTIAELIRGGMPAVEARKKVRAYIQKYQVK